MELVDVPLAVGTRAIVSPSDCPAEFTRRNPRPWTHRSPQSSRATSFGVHPARPSLEVSELQPIDERTFPAQVRSTFGDGHGHILVISDYSSAVL